MSNKKRMEGGICVKAAVTAQEIQTVLESKIGKELSSSSDFSGAIARYINAWDFACEDLRSFSKRLEDTIFQEIYTRLGRGMRYRSHDGTTVRIYSEDLPDLADRCLALLLPRVPVSSEACEILDSMAFSSGSYAALLTLYRCYSDHLGQGNLPFIAGILKQRADSEHLPPILQP